MRALNIALGVNTVAAWGPSGAGASVLDLDAVATGALRGYGATGVVVVTPVGLAATDPNQAGNIETSPDNVTWTAAQAYVSGAGPKMFNVALERYMRINNTSGTTNKTNFQLLV